MKKLNSMPGSKKKGALGKKKTEPPFAVCLNAWGWLWSIGIPIVRTTSWGRQKDQKTSRRYTENIE